MVPVSEKVDEETLTAEGRPGKEFFVKSSNARRGIRDRGVKAGMVGE
jgi:hypothetical protein